MSYVPPTEGTGAESSSAPDLLSGDTVAEQQAPSQTNGLTSTTETPSPVVVLGGPNENEQGGYVNMETGFSPDENDQTINPEELLNDGHSTVSSVLTAEGIHDVTGFCIVCFVILVGDMARGVMFPTLWPLVSLLGGTTVTLGFAVAAFSFGRIIVSPIFGSWSVEYGYKKVLTLSLSILMGGTLVYAQAQNVGSPSFLIFAQSMLGVGSGTLGVTRAFVAEVTATRARTRYMAWITAVQYAGFTVTPFFGSLFIKVLENHDYQFGYVYVLMIFSCFQGYCCSDSPSFIPPYTFHAQLVSIKHVHGPCLLYDSHLCHYSRHALYMLCRSSTTTNTKGQEKIQTSFCH